MVMSEEEEDHYFLLRLALFCCFILISGDFVAGDSLDTDREVLLQLRSFIEEQNPVFVNQGRYAEWDNEASSSPCNFSGISCSNSTAIRVIGIDLSASGITGNIFNNFSALTELSYLDLSSNTVGGYIPDDLGRCENLKFLNLSHNIINGNLNFTGLRSLEVLDLSLNRIQADIRLVIPLDCTNLVVANISCNNFTGDVGGIFESCLKLNYLDLGTNDLVGDLWSGFDQIEEISLSDNRFSGNVPPWIFTQNCSLRILDLSGNDFSGEFPGDISNCKNLEELTLWGNYFTGPIPEEIGLLPNVKALYFGSNNFSREIPESFIGLSSLVFLDLSRNSFGGDIQAIFGQLTQVRYLLLHYNSYTGGIQSSGVLNLPNLIRLDLSYNNFSGPLPVNVTRMTSLKFLVLAHNQFTGDIPDEYGHLTGLQALDLSYNMLDGSIPVSLGNLKSLLWLMLANNSLTGEIPTELGNCSSLLWLNLANNQLSGEFPRELTAIGGNATMTFMQNRESTMFPAGSGECLAMRRWFPADYPPFSFVYRLLTRKSCRQLWDRLLKGYGLFSVCLPGSNIREVHTAGYIQLSGNQFSGEIPAGIGNMVNFSMLHLGHNQFQGKLPLGIGQMPMIVLNLTNNMFSGEIPTEIGNIKCLQNLDLSYNNFSGQFPTSLNNVNDLNKFNISYNPYITGVIPSTGQLATFEIWSFLGDPLLHLPPFIINSSDDGGVSNIPVENNPRVGASVIVFGLILASLVAGLLILTVCLLRKKSAGSHSPRSPADEQKDLRGYSSSSDDSSPWLSHTVKVIRLDKTAFTHSDILQATRCFSDDRIIGVGGSGTVYRGLLPDGRQIAIKKIQTGGIEGERQFRSEMEVLTGKCLTSWPHPNLVPLYGWCLNGSEKLLIYEYMEGGSLEDLITDRIRLNWKRRLVVAIDVARALVFLHHECDPSIVHRDVKASNVLLDKNGTARVTDFGLARVVDAGVSHVSTMVAGTVGYVAPEYGQTWQATTKGDVYSYGVMVMELAAARRAVDGGEECLVEWGRRVVGDGRGGSRREATPVALLISGVAEGAGKMCDLLRIGILCTAENPNCRPSMKEVLSMLFMVYCT